MQQSTGQTAAQASSSWKPTHSVQSAGSMTKISSPWLIAWLGHSGSHAPQLMHSTVIIVDMTFLLYLQATTESPRAAARAGCDVRATTAPFRAGFRAPGLYRGARKEALRW